MTETQISADEKLDLTPLEPILGEHRGQKGAVIPVLQKAQKIYGYLPPEVLRTISAGLRVPLSKIYGVATFYSQFYLTRRGRHIVRQCDGTACHVRGAPKTRSTGWMPTWLMPMAAVCHSCASFTAKAPAACAR